MSAGYRLTQWILFNGQYYYQRYRSGGQFSKYDNSIPATFSTYLGGTGEVRAASLGASYQIPWGKSWLEVQALISQLRVTSDVVSPISLTQFYAGLSLWFDSNPK